MDPGTGLAVVSLALQVTNALLSYYELWTHADEDIIEIQRSLLALSNIFTQLDITLQKPELEEDIVSIIRLTMKGCDGTINSLKKRLEDMQQHDSPPKLRNRLRDKFKTLNRRVSYIFHRKEIEDLQSLLDKLRGDLGLAIKLLNLNTTATSVNELRQVHNELVELKSRTDETSEINRQVADEARQSSAKEWLAPYDISSAHLSAFERREPNTGRWFLESSCFTQWRSSESQFLWLVGNVGCGKTVLSSSIIEELRRAGSEHITARRDVLYFYFAFDDMSRQDVSSFLKSALAQLSLKDSVLSEIEKLHRMCGSRPPSTHELQTTFLAVLEFLTSNRVTNRKDDTSCRNNETFIVLDGLDEIPFGPKRSRMLQFLKLMSNRKFPRLHVLVSSRPEQDIRDNIDSLPVWRTFPVQQSDVEKDLKIFVDNGILASSKLHLQPENIKNDIKNKLVYGAGGMFQWAALQFQELTSRRILRARDIKNILSSLPSDLDATYERILLSIEPTLINEAKAAIQWLTCASRPLYLEELAEACIVQPDNTVAFEEDARLDPRDILDVLPGLIKIEPGLDQTTVVLPRRHKISLAHFSVKEYLLSERVQTGRASFYGVNTNLANQHILRSCVSYLKYCPSLSGPNTDTYPLRVYAYSHWTHHASLLPVDSEAIRDVVSYFKQPHACFTWSAIAPQLNIPFDAYKEQQWSSYYLFYYALVKGNQHIIKRLLDDNLDLRRNFILGDPLRLAISRARNSNGISSSLHHSSDGPFSGDNLVQLLLEAGCQVHTQHVFLAAENCSERTLSLVLTRASLISTEILLKATNFAIKEKRYQNADLLLHSLTLSRSTDLKEILFGQILDSAISINSATLMKYIFQRIPASILRQINTSTRLRRAILGNKLYAADVIANHDTTNISSKLRAFLAKRKRSMELSYGLVTLLTQIQPRFMSRIRQKLVCEQTYNLLDITLELPWWLLDPLPIYIFQISICFHGEDLARQNVISTVITWFYLKWAQIKSRFIARLGAL